MDPTRVQLCANRDTLWNVEQNFHQFLFRCTLNWQDYTEQLQDVGYILVDKTKIGRLKVCVFRISAVYFFFKNPVTKTPDFIVCERMIFGNDNNIFIVAARFI